MSADAPQTPATDPAWDKFSSELKLARAPFAQPPGPNDVARLLQRAEEAEAQAPSWLRVLAPAGALAVVVAGVLAFVLLRGEPEVAWTAKPVVATAVTTTGSVTETAADGRTIFSLGDDTVGVGPDSRVEIAAASNKATRLVLSKGSVAAHVDPSRGKRSFDVETPLGRVHVVGTIFRVRALEDELSVEVQRGTVEVTYGQQTSRVTANQLLTVKGGVGALSKVESAGVFDELNEKPAVVPPVPPQPEPVVEVQPVEEPEPAVKDEPASPKKKGAPAAKLAEWRTRASRGECGLVMVEVKKSLGQAPDDVPARMTLADCQRRTGDKKGAVESYLKASAGKGVEANRATLMAASVLQDELSQPARAIKLLDKYLARGAESRDLEASVLVRKARALLATGKKDQARAVADVVLKKFGDTSAAPDALRLRDSL
ncbi:MAG: FecR domain-containing protein [Myxococcaceae bacterium]|nr:FecR domain-containing protein [Myxococcaceae bacterium]